MKRQLISVKKILLTFLVVISMLLTRNNFISSIDSINNLTTNGIVYVIMFWVIFFCISKINFKEKNLINTGIYIAVSLWFSFFLVCGFIVRTSGKLNIFKISFIEVGYFVLMWMFLKFTIEFFSSKKFEFRDESVEQNSLKNFFFLKIWLIIFVCWLPYFIVYYPGVGPYDFACQLANFFGFPDIYYNLTSSYLKTGNYLNDHMPIMTTLLAGLFAKIGMRNGNVQFGVGLYSFLQMLLCSVLFASIISRLRYMRKKIVYCITLFFAVNPFFPLWAISLTKNTLLGILSAYYMALILNYVVHPKLINNFFWILKIILTSIAIIFVVKYGFLVTLITSIFVILVKINNYKKVIFVFLIPVVFSNFMYKSVIIPSFKITPGDPIESLSIPIQQVGRTLKNNPNNISEKNKEKINKVFFYDKIGKAYNPELADGIKFTTLRKKTVKKSDLKAFMEAWIDLLPKNFSTYVRSYLLLVYGYADINYDSWNFYTQIDTNVSLSHLTNGKYQLTNDRKNLKIRTEANNFRDKVFENPMLSYLIRPVCYIWISILVFVYLLIKRKFQFLVVLAPLIVQYGICFLSPVNGNPRYMLSFPIAMPILILLFYTVNLKKTTDY